MLRDNLAGLIEPMLSSAGAYPLALCTALRKSSDDRPPCLENPRPEGAESTLTENVASPFHAEPTQMIHLRRLSMILNATASDAAVLAYTSIGTMGKTRSTRAIWEKRTESSFSKSEVRKHTLSRRCRFGFIRDIGTGGLRDMQVTGFS